MSAHPFETWPRRGRRPLLAGLTVLALLPVVLGFVVHPLHDDRPGGKSIVAYEVAGSVKEARKVLDTWRREGVIDNAKALQIGDFLYPFIYAAAIAGCCVAAAGAWRRAGRERAARVGIAMAWVACAAAGFDYVENLGLDISLWHRPISPWPEISLVAAVVKFVLIYTALAYALSGLVARVHRPAETA